MDYIMKQMTIILGVIFYWFLNIIFIFHLKEVPLNIDILISNLLYSRWLFFELITDGGGGGEAKDPHPPHKSCHTYSAMMTFGRVILYLKKIKTIYKSRDTNLEFCRHSYSYFFIKNQQLLLYQEIQIWIAF